MTNTFDVAVVGAGPAGLMAAIRAAKQDASVVIIDRKKVVGEPVQCAEGTLALVLELFDLAEGPWIVNSPSRLRFHSNKGKSVTLKSPALELRILDRTLMEQELAKRAVENGAELLLEKTVLSVDNGDSGVMLHLDDGRVIKAKAVVGADGIESSIGRTVGLTKTLPLRDLGTAAQYRVRSDHWDDDMCELYFDYSRVPGGYIYVFPKGNGIFNLGAGFLGTSGKEHALEILDKLIEEKYPDIEILQKMGGCIPVGPPIETAVKGNVLLAGDSARHAYAQSGGGIHSALIAGAMAGNSVGKFVKDMNRAHLAEYDSNWKRELYKSLRKSHRRKNWVYKNDKNIERFIFLVRMLTPILRIMPSLLMRIWWGRKRSFD